jgi:hypothetical protein
MVFCLPFLAKRLEFEQNEVNSGLHYRNLHVPIGGTPTQEQQALAQRVMSHDGLPYDSGERLGGERLRCSRASS